MELVTNGTALRLIERATPEELRELGPNQLEWCRQRWPWFSDQRRMQRAAETYRLAGLEPGRITISETV